MLVLGIWPNGETRTVELNNSIEPLEAKLKLLKQALGTDTEPFKVFSIVSVKGRPTLLEAN